MSPHPCKRGADLNVRVRKRTLENLHAKTYKSYLLQSHDMGNIINFHEKIIQKMKFASEEKLFLPQSGWGLE